jgi:hypothetical protein
MQLVISQVFASITHSLSQHYTPLELKSEEAKNRYALPHLRPRLCINVDETTCSS